MAGCLPGSKRWATWESQLVTRASPVAKAAAKDADRDVIQGEAPEAPKGLGSGIPGLAAWGQLGLRRLRLPRADTCYGSCPSFQDLLLAQEPTSQITGLRESPDTPDPSRTCNVGGSRTVPPAQDCHGAPTLCIYFYLFGSTPGLSFSTRYL